MQNQNSLHSSIWQNPRFRGIVYQVGIAVLLIYGAWYIIDNAALNMAKRGSSPNIEFMSSNSGIGIVQTLIEYSEESSYWRAFLVSILNTLLVSSLSIVIATALGFIMGVARLSKNWLIAKIASVYVELCRNIPLLLQILFWYNAVLKPLPAPRRLYERGEVIAFGINNRGLYLPKPLFESGAWLPLIAFFAAVAFVFWNIGHAKRHFAQTGQYKPTLFVNLAVILIAPLLAFGAGYAIYGGLPISLEYAVMRAFQPDGGITVIPELFALTIALSVYTGAFIAEIVRSGIQSVDHGQTEAAGALGLQPGIILRLVVIPQAFQVIIPPLTSQYLNLTKNSSLAAAIAYPELVAVFAGTVLNQTGQEIVVLALTLSTYLLISLTTSMGMNYYNARVQVKQR